MKFDWLKSKHHLFDFLIAVLIIIVIILADILIIRMKSGLAEEKIENEKQSASSGDNLLDLTQAVLAGEKVFIPILNFHHIDTAPASLGKIDQSYYLQPDKFEEILQELLDNDYRPVFLSEIVKYLEEKKMPQEKIMAITFDDGNEDFYAQAWPILQPLKIKSSLYVMTGVKGKDWVTTDQMVELDKSGLVEIGSHTIWHPYLTRISQAEQLKELKGSKEFLEKLLNKNITILGYPFGLYNQQIKNLSQEVGYKAGLTFDQDAWQNPEDLMELKRISVYPGLDVIKFLEKLENSR